MTALSKKKIKRNLIIFITATLLCGWIGVLVDHIIPGQVQGESIGMTIWLITPLLTAILLRIFGGDGWRDARLLPRFRGNLKWYVISSLIFPIVTLVVSLLGSAIGWVDFSNFNLNILFRVFIGGLAINFIINFFEQSVWMGYLTSKLLNLNIKDLWLYVFVGSIWGLWHAPYYLVFLPDDLLYRVISVDRWVLVFGTIIVYIGWSIMFIEIYRITKSIWPLVLMHTVEDAWIESLIFGGQIEIAQGREIFVSPWVGIITTLSFVLIGLVIRRYRLKKEQR